MYSNLTLLTVSDCGSVDIVRPENGTVQLDQTILGSMAIFECNDNFQLVGDEVRVCEPTGWSGSNPSCGMFILSAFYHIIIMPRIIYGVKCDFCKF